MIAVAASLNTVDSNALAAVFVVHKQLPDGFTFPAFPAVGGGVDYLGYLRGFAAAVHRSESSATAFMAVFRGTGLSAFTEPLGFNSPAVGAGLRWLASRGFVAPVVAVTADTQPTIISFRNTATDL